jgi:hypothetical protein
MFVAEKRREGLADAQIASAIGGTNIPKSSAQVVAEGLDRPAEAAPATEPLKAPATPGTHPAWTF